MKSILYKVAFDENFNVSQSIVYPTWFIPRKTLITRRQSISHCDSKNKDGGVNKYRRNNMLQRLALGLVE